MKWWRLLFDLCFPKRCAVCGCTLNYHEQHFCLECYADMPLTHFWNVQDNPAERVFWGRCQVERVYSLFYYTDNWRKPVHLLKYEGNIPIGKYLGKMLGEKLSPLPDSHIYIVPIPLHWRKRVKRGYNQAEVIALGIKEGLETGSAGNGAGKVELLPELLRRRSFTNTQTAKDRTERWRNVKDAFEPNQRCRKTPPAGSHIILCDDVLTTGATLEACASILVENYGYRVSIATLAYVE